LKTKVHLIRVVATKCWSLHSLLEGLRAGLRAELFALTSIIRAKRIVIRTGTAVWLGILSIIDYGVSFELDQPIEINKPCYLHNGVRGSNRAKVFAMNCGDCLPILDPHEQHASANHLCQRNASLFQRASNELKASPRLRCGISEANGPPSGPSGAVPETATTFPTRTAREMPIFGSYGLPLEMSSRMITSDKTELSDSAL
jgi:hypothetical protein